MVLNGPGPRVRSWFAARSPTLPSMGSVILEWPLDNELCACPWWWQAVSCGHRSRMRNSTQAIRNSRTWPHGSLNCR